MAASAPSVRRTMRETTLERASLAQIELLATFERDPLRRFMWKVIRDERANANERHH